MMVATIGVETWIGVLVAIVAFWGIALWALVRTVRKEDRKAALIDRQGAIEPYSPRGLAELRSWIEANPNDPKVDEAKARYNEGVEAVDELDEAFYDWSASDRDRFEPID